MFDLSPETEKYLEQVEQELYQSIQKRKKTESWLFFTISQVTSASLSLLLFQVGANLVATYTLSSFVALLPGLLDFTGNISINSKKEWCVATPTTSLTKIAGGSITALTVNYHTWSRVKTTENGIDQTYKLIRKDEPFMEIFNSTLPLVLVLAIVAMLGLWRVKR